MIPPFDYKNPDTIDEAIDLLSQAEEKAKIIAGGTDLVIGLRNGDHTPQFVIDVTRIAELRKIEEKDGKIAIGAAVTHSEISSSSIIKKYGKVLSDAASEIGSPQIRNVGTIGGNIINASPAADTIPPLMVLNAVGRVMSKKGEREVPLRQLFKGPYETNLKPHELLAQVIFQKLPSDMRSSFLRLARRDAMAIARMSVAIVLHMEKKKNRIVDIRIAVGSVTPTPRRFSEAEDLLRGKTFDEEALRTASLKISETMINRTGIRPSTSYKRPVIEALFVRGMKKALEG
ncbi:MAG TPA: xanthine dehydrogenase family protein subunit M [Thermodesulfobacteriota bacterium]|nr:xanthine dehydrogenase family protein subunit M [Thermodesulfobacteriota bacterium]